MRWRSWAATTSRGSAASFFAAHEYHVFKPLLANPALRPIVGKKLGGKAAKMTSKLVPTTRSARASFVLADDEVLQLARWACAIEAHYGAPMDMEWAKDGVSGELFVVQARPRDRALAQGRGPASHLPAAEARAQARQRAGDRPVDRCRQVCRLRGAGEIERFEEGAVLVTRVTDPDWVPIMRKAAALVTDHGGRTSHAAIVSRELGLTPIVGTGNATEVLEDGMEVTVSCAEGDEGHVYEGRALAHFEALQDRKARRQIERLTRGYRTPEEGDRVLAERRATAWSAAPRASRST